MCRFAPEVRLLRFLFGSAGGALVNRYVRALTAEMEMVAAELQPQTVFFAAARLPS